MRNRSKFVLIAIAIVLFIVVTSFGSLINFITDIKWFNEVGYVKTFLTKIKSEFIIGVPMFLVIFLMLYFYIRKLVKKSDNDKIIELTKHKKKTHYFTLLGCALVSFVFTASVSSKLWLEILQFFEAKSFGVNDPIFGRDISFYMFKLPLINTTIGTIIDVLFILLFITIVFNVIGSIGSKISRVTQDFQNATGPQKIHISNYVDKSSIQKLINQISIIGFLLLITFGIKIYLSSYDLMYSGRGKVFGAGYTDIKITLNVYRILAVLCIVSAFTFFFGSRKKSIKWSLALPVVAIVISIIGTLAAGVVEKFIVEPDQLSKESKYLSNNIKYTQLAYGLDNVKKIDFDVKNDLTKEDIANNKNVFENIRINDAAPINQVYNKLQGIRPYYTFNDVDIDRYMIDGKYQQVYLSARELDQDLLNEHAKTWVNQYLKYTHGYGITLSQVNKVTSQGQPEMLVKDIPPTTETGLKIDRSEIYFGEKTNDYIIVNSNEKEFDYPAGSDNVESYYEGTAGIKLSFLNKAMFAIKEGNFKLLISNNINSNSKIVLNRNIIDRVKKIAPFLSYGDDPYIVVNQDDGKLYWIIDAYTASDKYPYSQPIKDSNTNYIRNSVKVVIDAYNGDTNFYINDESDPIVMTYNEIFDGLFKPLSSMPEGLRSHIKYPVQMLQIQSEMYRTYHMENPTVFFGREDIWDIAKQKYMDTEESVAPNYYMFKLPDEQETEFLLTVPYTPQSKDNMSAMLVARNDGENYGELILYKFPKNKTIKGTALIESKIDQDTDISSQLTLWSQKGSNVLRGDTLIIPIDNSLLYVEPIYLQADTESNFPEMKMVVVAYDDKIVMETTLDKALNKIFGDLYSDNFNQNNQTENQENNDENSNNDDDETLQNLIEKSNKLLDEANKAVKNGDWAEYGNKLKELESTLNELSKKAKVDEKDNSNNNSSSTDNSENSNNSDNSDNSQGDGNN